MDQPPATEPVSLELQPTRRHIPRFAIGLAAALVVIAAAAAAGVTIFLLAAGHGTVLDRMVPAGASAYGSLNLDPPADQKLDLLNLSHKLPHISSEKAVDDNLDQMLKPLGLSYTGDVKPWLGSQVVAVTGGGSKPDGALLFDSKDDTAAQKALVKLKTGGLARRAAWHTSQHGGVTLQVGTESGQAVVLAYFDHTLLAASSEALADQIIDTDQGRHARLDSTGEYKAITGRLPSSRLVTLFVDGHNVSGWADSVLGGFPKLTPGAGQIFSPPALDPSSIHAGLAAFKGAGFAVAARPDGLAADLEVDLDTSKLTADQRALYEHGGRPNPALGSVPAGAVAVLGISDLDTIFKSLPSSNTGGTGIDAAGLARKLTGDAAVEVERDGSGVGVGGIIGTSDPAGLRAMLEPLAGQQTGIGISFATSGQELLVASSPAELARLQAAGSGGSLAGAAPYRQAAGFAVSNPSSLLYVDVDGAFRLADSAGLGGADLQKQRSDWAAVRSVLLTAGGSSVRIHLVIG